MGKRFPGFGVRASQRYNLALGEVSYQVRLTWRPRTASWYLDLWKADGTGIALGRRLSPKWGPLAGLTLADAPAGYVLGVLGPDGYTKADLGDSLVLMAHEVAELAALVPTSTTPPITVTAVGG